MKLHLSTVFRGQEIRLFRKNEVFRAEGSKKKRTRTGGKRCLTKRPRGDCLRIKSHRPKRERGLYQLATSKKLLRERGLSQKMGKGMAVGSCKKIKRVAGDQAGSLYPPNHHSQESRKIQERYNVEKQGISSNTHKKKKIGRLEGVNNQGAFRKRGFLLTPGD